MKGTKEKPLSKFDKVALVIIAIYLAIAVPLVCCVDAFSVYWFFFGFFAVFCPIAFCYWYIRVYKDRCPYQQLDEIKLISAAITNIIMFWLFDLLYMAIFNDWLICKFVFGVLSIIVIFINLAKVFVKEGNATAFFLALELVIGLGLTIYLIYIIPIDSLRTIVTAIVAAVYGGLLTLSGVAWTIHRSDKLKKEEEIQKAKPIFTFEMQRTNAVDLTVKKVCTICDNEVGADFRCWAILENSNHSVFSIEEIYHDGKWCKAECNKVVLPNSRVYIDFRLNNLNDIYLKITDSLNNSYYYKLQTEWVGFKADVNGDLLTIYDMQEVCKPILIANGIIAEEKNDCVGQK